MRKGLVLVLVLVMLSVTVGAFAFENEPEGFRGLKWGDPPGEDMEQLPSYWGAWMDPDEHDFLWYEKQDDKLQIRGAELESIEYQFYKGQFYKVEINVVDGYYNHESLKDVVQLKFGVIDFEKKIPGISTKSYRWIGKKATIILEDSVSYESPELTIYSTEIDNQFHQDVAIIRKEEEEERQKAAEEGLDDF